jgi:formyl-CoA transferase
VAWPVAARNKRLVTADLRSAGGQALVRQLVAKADMVLENFRPGTMERWGMGYDVLSAEHPGLIMIRVSGYGQTGPYAGRAGYAAVGEAVGGMRHLCGEPDRPPSRTGLSIGDTLAATFACNAALAALHYRDRTGEGQVIDASIYESVLNVLESTIPEYTVDGYIRERSGATLPSIAPSNLYPCRDGLYLIAANQDTVFARLVAAIGQPDLAADERFADHAARGRNMEVLDEIIAEWTATRPVDEVDAAMQQAGVPAGRIFRVPDMLENEHYRARDAIVETPTEEYPSLRMHNVFPRMSKTQGEIRWTGQWKLGAHNAEVYGELLGLGEADLDELRRDGSI